MRFKEPKSGRVRIVPLADVLINPLKMHRRRHEKARKALGLAYQDHDLVFCNEDGTPWPPDIGLKGFRLRHAFASIQIKQGTSIKEVSELLGHSTPTITMSTYAHAMEGMAREAVNRLAESLLTVARRPATPRENVRNRSLWLGLRERR